MAMASKALVLHAPSTLYPAKTALSQDGMCLSRALWGSVGGQLPWVSQSVCLLSPLWDVWLSSSLGRLSQHVL